MPNVTHVHQRFNVKRATHYRARRRAITCCFEETSPDKEKGELVAGDMQTAPSRDSFLEPFDSLAPRHFINLTNGVEALPHISAIVSPDELRFTRIQSSHCESSAYNKLLASLDTELLFSLACGRACYVYDFGSRNKSRGVPRALFLGLQFVKWSLSYLWFKGEQDMIPEKVFVRGKNTVPYWRDEVMPYMIEKDTKKRIRYFAPFAKERGLLHVRLHGVYGRVSAIDGRKSVHVKIVHDWLAQEDASRKGHGEEERDLTECFRAQGLAEFQADLTKEELVTIQEWMEGFRIQS